MSAPNQTAAPEPSTNGSESPAIPPGLGWFQRLAAILFIIFCFELGLFLLIYPWTDAWTSNYFATAVPGSVVTLWHTLWINRYLRGCVSGIGVVNLWIALAEVFRLFSRHTHKHA